VGTLTADPTAVKNGTLTLDFAQAASPVNNVINPSSALSLGGATSGAGTTNFACSDHERQSGRGKFSDL
jgi:hypothetical protein